MDCEELDKKQIFTILLIALPITALIIGGSAIIVMINSLQDKPPTIYNPLYYDLNASQNILIDVVVKDDRLVNSVTLTYTNNSWSTSHAVSMTNLITFWSGFIPAQDNETTVQFYIKALDSGGNFAINNNNTNNFTLYIVSIIP